MKRNPLCTIKHFSLFEYHQPFPDDNSVHDPAFNNFHYPSKFLHELQGVL